MFVGRNGQCLTNPCHGGGTCEEHDGTFTCFCTADRTGDLCERQLSETDVAVASFNGQSFVELQPLQNVDHKVSIDMEVRPEAGSRDGIIFYAHQNPNGDGDFLSVTLRRGYVEFRYDLGSGLAVIRSTRRLVPGRWHRIQAKRWHKDGMLKVDGLDDVSGQSGGDLRSLDIDREPTFVGGIPGPRTGKVFKNLTRIATNLGLDDVHGFHGCIKKFKLGHKDIKIQSIHEPLSIRRNEISECKNPDVSRPLPEKKCKKSFCSNGGLCILKEGERRCICKKDFYGARCQFSKSISSDVMSNSVVQTQKMNPNSMFVPAFKSKAASTSYLELPTLKHVSKAFLIEIWFLTHSHGKFPLLKFEYKASKFNIFADGMLLYNGQTSNGNGDFLSLNLVDGLIQYRYDLGSGVANLTSAPDNARISLNQWHSVKITRNGPHGTLQVDDGKIVSGSSFAPLTELNLETSLFLGGFRYAYTLNRDSGITVGLNGAIQRLIVNGNTIEDLVGHAKDSRGISRYLGPPCDNPNDPTPKCLNGGICVPEMSSFKCKCANGFMGQNCEKSTTWATILALLFITLNPLGIADVDDKTPVNFDGKTFLKVANKVSRK